MLRHDLHWQHIYIYISHFIQQDYLIQQTQMLCKNISLESFLRLSWLCVTRPSNSLICSVLQPLAVSRVCKDPELTNKDNLCRERSNSTVTRRFFYLLLQRTESSQPDSNKELDQFHHHTSWQNTVTADFWYLMKTCSLMKCLKVL